VLLSLDSNWSMETWLSQSSKGKDKMFYGEKKQPYESVAHIIGLCMIVLKSGKLCI
jgi:hypothetical protein